MSQYSSVPLVKDAGNLNFIVQITITVSVWMLHDMDACVL